MNRNVMAYLELKKIPSGSYYVAFYKEDYDDYGYGQIYPSLIEENSAVIFSDSNFVSYDVESKAEVLTTSLLKLSLYYFDIIMLNNGSTIDHTDLNFWF